MTDRTHRTTHARHFIRSRVLPARLSHRAIAVVVAAAAVLAIFGCRGVPVTGRRQLLLTPESQEISNGLAAYQDVTSKEPPSQNRLYVDMVNRVGRRIAAVSGRTDYQWEFRVIASPVQNAFCLPGGKVAVYEGLIPVCENEAGLAVVMSHEISHALARHGGERMSQEMVSGGIERAVGYAVQDQAEMQREIVLGAYGVASKYGVLLPYSREHEAEADHIGLILMAKAGYDPREAPQFWRRFAAAEQGEAPPEFLSTHPSDQTRAAALEALVPIAMKDYDAVPIKYGLGDSLAPGASSRGSYAQESGPAAPYENSRAASLRNSGRR